MYKVIGSVKTRAFRVIWMLEELGEPYELIAAAPRSDELNDRHGRRSLASRAKL